MNPQHEDWRHFLRAAKLMNAESKYAAVASGNVLRL